jgi:hypothetical protein
MKIWIYWSESNLWIYFYIVLKIKLKNLVVRAKFYWSWARGPVLIVKTGKKFNGNFEWCDLFTIQDILTFLSSWSIIFFSVYTGNADANKKEELAKSWVITKIQGLSDLSARRTNVFPYLYFTTVRFVISAIRPNYLLVVLGVHRWLFHILIFYYKASQPIQKGII